MKCLYEVLGVEASVDDAAIRSAYRKMALQYHPDKNQHDPTAAEERFKEVQNAYEILSDKHERAWYDAHRDSILRSGERHQAGGGAGEGMGVRPDDFVDVYAYFTSTCYSGFGDGPRGFYGVYDALFATLAEQEAAASAARAERRGGASPSRLPGFGLSGAPWLEVAAFYAEWDNFTSARDFSWADEYNPASAPNRRVRRAMEQDNERKRKAARKEYNEGVRALVDFVKKRDKRVAAHAVEEAKRRQERQAAESARREREKQERAARAAAYQAAAWAASDSSDGDSDEEDPYLEEQLIWHCPVCDKHFKSEASMANHERSKRHRELVELLRLELEAEEAELGGGPFAAADEEEEDLSEEEEEEETSSDDSASTSSGSESETESEGGSVTSEEPSSASSAESEESEEEEVDEEEDEEAMLARLMSSHASLSRALGRSSDEEEESEEKEEEAEGSEAEEEAEVEGPPLGGPAAVDSSDDDDDWGASKKAPKRKGKRGGKAGGGGGGEAPQPVPQPMAQPAPQAKGKGARKKGGGNGAAAAAAPPPESELACSVCRTEFPSRNQLFKHIKETGHAQLKYR